MIAPRAAEVISAYVASAELATRAPPPPWGACLCTYPAEVSPPWHSVRPAPDGPRYQNWRVRPIPPSDHLTGCSRYATNK